MERGPGPGRSAVVPDVRGEGRALRATWHPEAGVVVLSVWRDNLCVATARLTPEDAATLGLVLAPGPETRQPAARASHSATRPTYLPGSWPSRGIRAL